MILFSFPYAGELALNAALRTNKKRREEKTIGIVAAL